MLIGAQSQRQMKPKGNKYTLMNIDLDEVNRADVKYEVNIPYDTLLIYYQSEIQVVCLAEMKLERIIDYIPCSITSAGVHSTGVYLTSNRRRASEIFIHDRETICHPINIAVESCILAHLACEYDDEPYIVVLCADFTLKIYSARSGERIVDKKIAILAELSPISFSLSILEETKWICICVDGKTLVFVDMRDWHASYPISEHFEGIEMVMELNSRGPYCVIVWNDVESDKHTKTQSKVISLMKLPPENDEGTFDCEHHRIPVDGETDMLDCVCADDSLLILLQSGSAIKLIQFINQDPSPRFNFINEFIETKYQFIFARIIPETFYSEEDSLEAGVNVYLFFPKCQNIGIYEFHQNPELIGSIEHAEKFNEHIKLTSNRNMLKSNSRDTGSEIFNDNDISKLLKQGYLEQIGSTLLLKQPGTDGYHTNMGDLRDFIEKWSSKFESKINNVIIDSVLKYFNPEKYGSTFETKRSIMNKAEEAEKSIQSLVKLYHYILHRRILEGKEKQINLRADKLNISDISDIKMIEKRCVQIESNVRFLKYMNWFTEHDFFIGYYEKLESLQGKHKERNESKIQHYKRNFDQSIKNFILADSLFIDKIIEETVGSAGAADYRSILRSNKLTDFQYNVNNEDQVPPVALSYPLNGIEDFIILLKSTNIDKIKDYVVLYTLLDLDFPADSTPIIQLVNSLQCEDSLKEIMFYWRLESSYNDESNLQYTIKDVQGLEFIPKEWTPSVLQTLLELKHFSAMRIWQDWSQTSPNSQVVQALDPKMQKTFELMIYSLCESGKYNQAFLSLLEIEERVNPIRYKNIFKLFIGHMISNGKFEHLCSYHLSERQEDLAKEYFKSRDSGMHQIFYLSFIAARGSTLEGLKNAVKFFDKLQSESQNINSFGAEEAGILVPIVGMLIKLYAHTLPPIQKKFAFDYLKLEQGKFQIALSTKMAKENNIKMETDHDYEGSSAHFSDQGRYTPFLSRQVDDIMKSEIPKEFERSFVAPRPRDTEGKTSIIKNFPREETRETPSGMNVLEKIGMQTPKPDPKFLSIQKRDHLLDDHHHEDIVFSEQDEDISAGKATVSKWMTNLKNKNDERKNYRTQDPLISVSKENPFAKKRGYGDMDLIDSFRGRKSKNVPSSSPSQSEKEPQDFRRITKESLLAGLPDRVLNLSTKDVKQEKNEEDKEEQKSEVNSDEKYTPSSSNRDVEMDPDDGYKSSQNHNNSIKEEIEQVDIDDSENYGDQQESDIAVEEDIVVDPSPAPSSKNLDEVSGMSPSGNNISHEAFGHQESDIDFDPDPESLIIPRKSSSSEKKSSSSEKKSSSSEKKSSSSEKKSFSREKESSRQKGNSQEGEDNINDNEANDDNEDNEDADMQPAELSSIHLSTPPKKRRMSFEMQKQNLFEFPSDQQNDYEFELLGDPNTHDPNPVGIRPRWSKANDDIELEKRKKIAKRKRIMGFLYGGNMPHLRRNTSKYKDINVGSDHSPAKDLESQQLMSSQKKNELERISSKEELSSKGSRKHRREEDKEHNEEVERDDRIYSEQVYNQNSSFNSKASNRNIGEATRSQAQAIMMEDRVTDSANLLEKVKRVVQQDNVKEQADNLDVVQEESSERSVVSGIAISSNNSQAAPPANDGEPDIVFEALSSKSGENKNSQSNGSQNQNEPSPMRTRAQAVISKNKRKKYQGKKRKF